MEEMTIQEKARRYDEAIERARKLKENPKAIFFEEKNVHVSDYIFPELQESEDEDERIRKELISLFQDGIDGVNHRYNGSDCRRWITWLKEQGKHKTVQHKRKYIYINQNIIDYINKRKGRFENKMPHIGDVWHIREITSYTGVNGGQPVVEVENKDGEWMRLPLDIVDIRK